MALRRFSIPALALAFPGVASAAVSPKADALFTLPGGVPLNNSFLTGLVIASLFILVLRWAIGNPRLVPGRVQGLLETVVQGISDLVSPIVGKKAIGTALPVLLALFFFILIQNWSGLLPGVGSIGWGAENADGKFKVLEPLIRPANADWNGTIALAIVAMSLWLFTVLKHAGPKVLLHDLFGNKSEIKEVGVALWLFLGAIFLMVGVIEVVSIAIRPFTLSVRLFGNVFGGESLLHATAGGAVVFHFMELLVGLVQSVVFVLLTSVYIGLICNHGDDHDHDHDPAEGKHA